jgi:hypothetical protein
VEVRGSNPRPPTILKNSYLLESLSDPEGLFVFGGEASVSPLAKY